MLPSNSNPDGGETENPSTPDGQLAAWVQAATGATLASARAPANAAGASAPAESASRQSPPADPPPYDSVVASSSTNPATFAHANAPLEADNVDEQLPAYVPPPSADALQDEVRAAFDGLRGDRPRTANLARQVYARADLTVEMGRLAFESHMRELRREAHEVNPVRRAINFFDRENGMSANSAMRPAIQTAVSVVDGTNNTEIMFDAIVSSQELRGRLAERDAYSPGANLRNLTAYLRRQLNLPAPAGAPQQANVQPVNAPPPAEPPPPDYQPTDPQNPGSGERA